MLSAMFFELRSLSGQRRQDIRHERVKRVRIPAVPATVDLQSQ